MKFAQVSTASKYLAAQKLGAPVGDPGEGRHKGGGAGIIITSRTYNINFIKVRRGISHLWSASTNEARTHSVPNCCQLRFSTAPNFED